MCLGVLRCVEVWCAAVSVVVQLWGYVVLW